jgi:hypothetical protein
MRELVTAAPRAGCWQQAAGAERGGLEANGPTMGANCGEGIHEPGGGGEGGKWEGGRPGGGKRTAILCLPLPPAAAHKDLTDTCEAAMVTSKERGITRRYLNFHLARFS